MKQKETLQERLNSVVISPEMRKEYLRSQMDNILLDSIGKSEYGSFRNYQKEMENFKFKHVFRGKEED